jgi:tetratricopeptide (TPR) repeat protein
MRRFSFLLLLALTSIAVPVFAQPRTREAATSAEDQKKAQEHFQKARELYSSGRYGDALSELEIARNLDPKAKDLVMNLGIVNEKLQKYDDAIAWFKTFLEMDDITPAEKSRAENFIKRIEGAKKEQAARKPPPPPTTTATPTPTGAATNPPPPPESTERGRVDGLTIGAGVLAGAGLAAGATFGAIALGTRPNNFTTGTDGSYADLQSKTDNAHTFAIIADVGLGVAVVAGIAALYLYFGRTKEPTKTGLIVPTARGFAF